ncbi:DUF883 family protein [Euryhalocaulis caribicus]|uniref:DUF883 family protein n=1 Tax=Euryhalocaulis caribicus TaxID=1161401 RepID=UPI00039C8ACA|nr:DUF883 family protein [Euryhalocaulis caribicus]
MATTTKQTDDKYALKEDIDALRGDLSQLMKDVKTLAEHESKEVSKKVGAWSEAAQDEVAARRQDLESQVRENPLGALATAAGVGFLMALILGRK